MGSNSLAGKLRQIHLRYERKITTCPVWPRKTGRKVRDTAGLGGAYGHHKSGRSRYFCSSRIKVRRSETYTGFEVGGAVAGYRHAGFAGERLTAHRWLFRS